MKDIEANIGRVTKNNTEAINLFRAASKRLTDAGWGRCKTVEQRSAWSNIEHKDYNVVETPRDGKCMYHCLLHILKAEWVEQAPETPQQLRQELARYVARQVPPEGMEKGKYGGIWANNEYLHLEEALESKYGGEAALAVFVQVYDVTIHCHAPETRNTIETFEGSNPVDQLNPQGYHMLQTYGWKTWNIVEKRDPKTQINTTTYNHNYAGDHWQLLEPKGGQGASKKLRFDSDTPSAASAASTAPKLQVSAASTTPTSTGPADAVLQRQGVEPKPLALGDTDPIPMSAAPKEQLMLRAV
jgi:hypothetical protein